MIFELLGLAVLTVQSCVLFAVLIKPCSLYNIFNKGSG